MEFNNNQSEYLWEMLANPADKSPSRMPYLQALVDEYPQSGLLRALLARAGDDRLIKNAAVSFNNRLLYQVIRKPDSLPVLQSSQVILQQDTPGLIRPVEAETINTFSEWQENEVAATEPDDHVSTVAVDLLEEQKEHYDIDVFGDADLIPPVHEDEFPKSGNTFVPETGDEQLSEQQPETIANFQYVAEEAPSKEEPVLETWPPQDDTDTDEASAPVENVFSVNGPADEQPAEMVPEPFVPVQQDTHEIEDEVFDEIVSIEEIYIEQAVPADEPIVEPVPDVAEIKENKLLINDEADKLMFSNIAATDYFVFDRAFGEPRAGEITDDTTSVTDQEDAELPRSVDAVAGHIEETQVSKYHDEKMPYSFMWWLDKTRREHAGIYQPYVNSKAPGFSQISKKSTTDELQQQYIENIFHLTSVDDLSRNTIQQSNQHEVKRKEDEIIERFIQVEPQIKPPSSEKLDNENKAKKSSEDADELVTETLARIYTDQMLYHKAIATYKKLMLKFPEKRRYFASQIEILERKIN